MKQFSVISFFYVVVALATAQPPGYRYGGPSAPPQPLPSPGNFRPPSNIYSPVQSPPLPSFNFQPQQPQLPLPPPPPVPISLPAPEPVSLPQQSYGPPTQQQLPFSQPAFQPLQRPQSAIITKDIYIHSAPEDHEEAAFGQQLDNAPIRKNYRIVFIKAPSQNLNLAASALKRAQASHEEKTVIYVLSKKPDFSNLHQQLQQAQSEQKTNKPEVYFIKYKTQEEAQRAQQEIQAQYDSLGGTTHISDEGIAPIHSVSSISHGSAQLSLPISAPGPSFSQQSFQSSSFGGSSSGFDGIPSPRYLPAKTVK